MSDTIIEDISLSEDLETGKFYLFFVPNLPKDKMFGFSSVLENIGNLEKHDRWLKNNTKVLVLSEPTEAFHPLMGPILVSKIMAHEIMWVGTHSLQIIEDNPKDKS